MKILGYKKIIRKEGRLITVVVTFVILPFPQDQIRNEWTAGDIGTDCFY